MDLTGVYDDLHPRTAALMGAAGVVGFLALVMSPLRLRVVTDLAFGSLLQPSLALVLLAAVPSLVVAALSLEQFRVESLVGLVFLLGGLVSSRALFFGLFVSLSMVFSSYKARSVYNGKNEFWTLFSIAGSAVFLLALIMGLFVGQTFYTDTGARQDFQDAMLGEVTDQAMTAVNATLGGGGGSSLLDQQQGSLARIIERAARNTSRLSVVATRRTVMSQVDRANEEFGLFSDQGERQLLVNSFDTAETEIPPRVADRVGAQFNASVAEQSLAPSEDQLRQDVRGRAERLFNIVFEDPRRLAVMGFFMVFSTMMFLKLPLALLSAVLAWAGLLVLRRVL